jgi:hypothetical protein
MRRDRDYLATLASVMVLALALTAAGLSLAGCTKKEVATTTISTTGIVEKVLAAGENWAITETSELDSLTIGEGASITPPPGKSVTLTVDGVELGQRLATTAGYDLVFIPDVYVGDVVLTVADANPVEYKAAGASGAAASPIVQPFRQALCVDDVGFSEFKSVLAAVAGTQPTADGADDITISSTGECFNGIFASSSYVVKNAEINLSGNGRSDSSGYGAGVVGTGVGTTLVLDGANITTTGAARSAVVASDGANVIVKNSEIQTNNGDLPDDYVPTIDPLQIRSAPWMLGLSGNVRATNLLGTNTKAAYINTSLGSEGWGVLSTDGCVNPTLTAIHSQIAVNGQDGYGSYGVGGATEYFLGCDLNVASYATISRRSFLHYGDSTPEKVSELNSGLGLGLTAEELAAIPSQGTIVNSLRFGVMWHGGGTSGDAGTLDITGATVFNTKEAVFLDKGQAVKVTVDGTAGAKLNPENGILMQVMDDDDPGADMSTMRTTNIYNEPTTPAEVDSAHDLLRAAEGSDALVTFKNIELMGDFYNSTRGGLGLVDIAPVGEAEQTTTTAVGGTTTTGSGSTTTTKATTTTTKATTTTTKATTGGGGTSTTGAGATTTTTLPGTAMASISKNLCLTFDNAKITGVITASSAVHTKDATSGTVSQTTSTGAGGAATTTSGTVPKTTTTKAGGGPTTTTTSLALQPTITSADYRLLGEVLNTPAAAVNNGVVIVLTNASVWTVTGTSYVTSLAIGKGCSVVAPAGKKLTLKVNGKKKELKAGITYKGKVELIVQ